MTSADHKENSHQGFKKKKRKEKRDSFGLNKTAGVEYREYICVLTSHSMSASRWHQLIILFPSEISENDHVQLVSCSAM